MHRAELALGMGAELRQQVRNQRRDIRKLTPEELRRAVRNGQRGKAALSLARKKQGRGKASIGVRQSDEHESAARPNVQRAGIERRAAIHRGDGQLLVVMIEEFLAHLHVGAEYQARAHGRTGAVGGHRGS